MTKKVAYERPTLVKAGRFAEKTAGSLFTSCRESFVTQKPASICN
ncbi:keywimysin-related RiPP [Micromonospora echinospora]|jgi:hypothetical protein|uniref:Lasso RiPP family leader peptide-containing protein n=1 Tax=Micromonospora echinospora TaxID=1877 RepID=A0A1C4ZT02_MICEC|nr:keywimysin-related RiPP [Micromonospora echinospora]SCF35901.1 hypothetical protein GA0070618_5708 [Micromonospora echinospora]